MGLTLMLILFVIGVIAASVMVYRTIGKGKREDTSPEAGTRPGVQPKNPSDRVR